ncbi:protein mab-21-like 3 [Protopterus annectens]|uniref:protein mab-21-like 3 n=1 Tax=Protopterus annectens TaxID=7888 RepID=UPI001CFB3A4C|nr:protein mab-21-like 3 [Protopterus annectens]
MLCAGFSWGSLDSKVLSKFLNEEVWISREESKKALDKALSKVTTILQCMEERDPRFGSQPHKSGSYIERLQVSDPDEFDFMVPLEEFPKLVPVKVPFQLQLQHPSPPVDKSYVAVCLHLFPYTSPWQKNDVSELVQEGRIIIPKKVMSTFKKNVIQALETMKQRGSVDVHQLRQGTPAVTFTMTHNRNEIDVDLVPFIKDPFVTWSLPWPRFLRAWPSTDKIEKVKKTGVDLVAKHPLYWRYSFSRAERVLLEGIDSDGGCRRASLQILKKIRIDFWERKFGKVLVSYHLKTVLFWACEAYPQSCDWTDLSTSFKRLVDILIYSLSHMHLPHYFLGSDVNLFRKDCWPKLYNLCYEVKKFRRNPEWYLEED